MRMDTPLQEVALHLPRDAARLLGGADSDVQVSVLGAIRAMICYWESHRVDLDPITYEAVLNSCTAALVPTMNEVVRLRGLIATITTDDGAST